MKKYLDTLTDSLEKSKTVLFAFLLMRNIAAFSSGFPVKWTCCIAFGSASSFCCLLNSFIITYYLFLKIGIII